jgi:hypothetical protein
MSLLFFDGCQDSILVPKPEYSPANPWNAIGTGRSGETNGAAACQSTASTDLTLPTTAATCIFGQAVKHSVIGSTAMFIGFQDTAFTTQVVMTINSSGFIEVRRTNGTGTLLGTTTTHTPIVANTFVHIAAKVILHTSTGAFTIQVNGVTVLTLTGVVTSSTISNVARVRWTCTGGQSITVDDIYAADAVDATATQGRTNNDFLGDLRVQSMFPTAAGDVTQWTPNSAVANWTTVDETPPVTTDYNSDATAGHQDLYNLTDLTGTIATVYAVRESLYALKSDAGTALIKPLIKENAVVTSETGQGLGITAGTVCGIHRWVRPSDSAVWTTSDINALQAGLRSPDDHLPDRNLT